VRSLIVVPFALILGCGSSPAPAEAPAASATPVADSAPADSAKANGDDASGPVAMPSACESGATGCVMPRAFVKALCQKAYPDLAMYFFQKGSPWRRAYVGVKEAAPFNGLGGPSAEEKLVFDEEVLVLGEKKADTGGMQVSGAGATYDVLRWDGTCATLSGSEVRFDNPPKPKHAAVVYRFLEDGTQEALGKNEKLASTVLDRKKECKGATMGNVTLKCEQIDKKLNDLIVDAVRNGVSVPAPTKKP
jgi:hypothetical protein